MFTKDDYDRYFNEIARVERKMIYKSYDLGQEIDEPVLTQALRKIGDDEVRHYGYVLKMLRHIDDPQQYERRREVREYALGIILMRTSGSPAKREMRGYCVNLSEGGLCLECGPELSVGEIWELEIRLFGKETPIVHRAKVVWRKEVESGFFIAGFMFLDK